MARRRMNGSATARISMAVTTRVKHVLLLERVLQREGIDDRRQHAHVVGSRAVHAARAGRQPAEDVAAADDDRGLDAKRLNLTDIVGDASRHGGIDAELLVAHQGFARQFQQDALVGRGWGGVRGHRKTIISRKARSLGAGPSFSLIPQAEGRYSAPSPTRNRTNRLTWMFSPVFALACATSWLTDTLSSRIYGWSSSTNCE